MHPLHSFIFCPRCGSNQFNEHDFKSKNCRECGFTYYFNSSAATAAFITDDEQRLLVVRRAKEPAKGTLDLPGGFVDLYETAEEALKREVKEETGLELKEIKYLFSLPNTYNYSNFEVHTVDLFFESSICQKEGIMPADDVSEIIFLHRNEIDSSLFGLASIKNAIENWQKKNIFAPTLSSKQSI